MHDRISWNEYFLNLAEQVATRSTCLHRKVGAILTRNNRIISTGYNGSPSGFPHCTETGCLRDKNNLVSGVRTEMCMATHAEANCIIQAANMGSSIEGAILYCTLQPCSYCARMIVNSGIVQLVYKGSYPDELAKQILENSFLEIVIL